MRQPLYRVYETIRYDKRQFQLVGEGSLEADVDSLTRMVVDFACEKSKLASSEISELQERVSLSFVFVCWTTFR